MEFGQNPSGAAGAAGDVIKDGTTTELRQGRDRSVEADAGHRRFLGAVVRALQAAHAGARKGRARAGGKVRLVKINIDEHPDIAQQLRVQSIPTVYAFATGGPVDGFTGAQPESAIKAFIERLIGDGDAADLESRDRGRREGVRGRRPADRGGNLRERPPGGGRQRQGAGRRSRAAISRPAISNAPSRRSRLAPPEKRDAAPLASVRAAVALAKRGRQAPATSAS